MNVLNCVFCKIINKEIPSDIIYEDNEVIAFLDVNPKKEGHTLVIPKDHYSTIEEKRDNIDFMEKIQKVLEKMHNRYEFEDYNVIVNNGPLAGQEVPHLHFHIIPAKE